LCAAIWNTESPLVYTMGLPVRRCSSPSSAMISVPEAGRFPRAFFPTARSNGSMTSGGNPFGYRGNGRSSTIPHISQWPVVVSLPADLSVSFPWAVPASARASKPWISVRSPIPRPARLGASRPPTARAVLPRVSAP
jgi:hypothetical protein